MHFLITIEKLYQLGERRTMSFFFNFRELNIRQLWNLFPQKLYIVDFFVQSTFNIQIGYRN